MMDLVLVIIPDRFLEQRPRRQGMKISEMVRACEFAGVLASSELRKHFGQ